MKPFKPTILHLDPKSVARVFRIVDLFTNLYRRPLKTGENLKGIIFSENYSVKEKYFVILYINMHLNKTNTNTFVYRQMTEMETFEKNEHNGEIGDLEKLNTSAEAHIERIKEVCRLYLPEVEKEYKNSLHGELPYAAYDSTFELVAFNSIRLPLHIKLHPQEDDNELKSLIREILQTILDENDADLLLGNSFGASQLSPRLLDLNYNNIGAVRDKFFEIYELYKQRIDVFKDHADSEHKKYWNKTVNDSTELSKGVRDLFTLPNKDLYNKLTNKTHFAEIIFISFRQVREKFVKANLKRDISVKEYIKENIEKNMVERKK